MHYNLIITRPYHFYYINLLSHTATKMSIKMSPLLQAALSARTTRTTVHPNIKTPGIYVRIPLPRLLLGRISSSSANSPPLLQYYYHHYAHRCCHHQHDNRHLCPHHHHHHLAVYTDVKGVIILSLSY